MKITMLDMSGEMSLEPEDVINGDLLVVFTFMNKENAGLAGRKLAQLMYKEVEFVETQDGVLIKECDESQGSVNLRG